MRNWKRQLVFLAAVSALCAAGGGVFGIPVTNGPCKTDATSTCAFACAPSGTANVWISSADTTQVSYCDNSNNVKCNPKAAFVSCAISRWGNASCSNPANPATGTNAAPKCQ